MSESETILVTGPGAPRTSVDIPPVHAIAPQREPLIGLLGAVVFGTMLDVALRPPALAAIAASAVMLTAWMRLRNRRALLAVVMLLAAVALGAAAYHSERHGRASAPVSPPLRGGPTSTPVVLEATVCSVPTVRSATVMRFGRSSHSPQTTFFVDAVRRRRGMRWVRASERLVVRAMGRVPLEAVGCRVRLYGLFEVPRRALNPGGFSQLKWYDRHGIAGRVTLASKEHLQVIDERRGLIGYLRLRLATWRASCARLLQPHLSERHRALAAALLWGDRSGIDSEHWSEFQESGTAHLLAVSGLHLAFVVAGLWYLQFVWFHRRRAILLGVTLVALGYVLFTGARPPVLRASIVLALASVAWGTLRYVSARQLLAAAAIVVWLCDPACWRDAGVQLSFAAVSVLAWWRETAPENVPRAPLDQLLFESRPWWLRAGHAGLLRLARTLGWSASVSALTGPLVWYHFGIFAPAGIVLCPLVALPVSLAMGTGLLFLVASAVGVPAGLLAVGLNGALGAVEALVALGDRFVPSLASPLPARSPVVLFYVTLLVAWIALRSRLRRRWVGALWSILVLWVVVGQTIRTAPHGAQRLECVLFSVEHGQCVWIRFPDGHSVLYDAGTLGNARHRATEISRALARFGCYGLSQIVVSHADRDHYSLVSELAERLRVRQIVVGPRSLRRDRALCRVIGRLREQGVELRVAARGDRFEIAGATCELIHPDVIWRPAHDNEDSLVVKLTYEGRVIVIPGDIEGNGLEALPWNLIRSVDLLVAPHHGSRNSDPLRWLRATGARTVAISGSRSRAAETIAAWSRGTPRPLVLHTAVDGAIRVVVERSRVTVHVWDGERGVWRPVTTTVSAHRASRSAPKPGHFSPGRRNAGRRERRTTVAVSDPTTRCASTA